MKIEKRMILLVILCAGFTSATAYAAIVASRSLSATVTIQSATPGLSVRESTCVTELTSISFSSLGPNPNDFTEFSVCVSNNGNVNYYFLSSPSSIVFSGLPPGVSGSWTGKTGLSEPNSAAYPVLRLTNDGTAAPGSIIITITFIGYQTSTG